MINYAHLKSQMIQLLDLLRSILYPNVFDAMEEAHSKEELEAAARRQLREILERIYREPPQYDDVIDTLFSKLPAIRDTLDTDVQAAYEGDPAATSAGETIFCYPSLLTMTHHRIAHELYNLGVPVIPRIISEMAHSATGIDIHPGAKIGHHFSIDHGTGTVIGETSVIGNYVRIFQGVSLAGEKLPPDENGNAIRGVARHPILEDHVTVYSNSTLIGKIRIGRGATICGNVWIAEDVPAGSTVTQLKIEN